MKFKIGDLVRIRPDLEFTVNKSIGVVPSMCAYGGSIAKITKVGKGFYNLDIDNCKWAWSDEMFIKGGIMFEVGQEVIDKDGYKRKVLAVTGLLTALSDTDYYDRFEDWYTDEELEDGGFKEVSDEEVEVSMDDIADKFGIDVEKLKIKKED